MIVLRGLGVLDLFLLAVHEEVSLTIRLSTIAESHLLVFRDADLGFDKSDVSVKVVRFPGLVTHEYPARACLVLIRFLLVFVDLLEVAIVPTLLPLMRTDNLRLHLI